MTRKLDEEYAAKLSVALTVSPSAGPFERGVVKKLTFSLATKFDGKAIDADTAPTLHMGNESPIPLAKTNTGIYAAEVSFSASPGACYSQPTVKGITRKTNTITPAFYWPIYYGVSAKAALVEADIASLTKKVAASAAGTYNFTFTAGTYAYILIPDGVSVPASLAGSQPQGSEGPLPVLFTKLADITKSGVAYKVYRIADAQGASTHSVKFA